MNEQTASPSPLPRLSVVVGSHNACGSIGDCLAALQRNAVAQPDLQIVVVDNSADGTQQIVGREFPGIQLIGAPASAHIPQLWEIGINHSRGGVVAITTAHCVPDDNWAEQILLAHQAPNPGIGGAIENDQAANLVDWAIYFCRYAPYMLPFAEKTTHDIAGDNASYKRHALEKCREARRNGFWEPVVHAVMQRDGSQLLLTPTIVVRHKKSFSFGGFMVQRFRHGGQFGSDRAAALTALRRSVYILMSPLIPGIFLLRISRNVLARQRHGPQFVLCLPVLVMFLLSWSAGELSGYLGLARPRQ